ncbi:MAG: quinone oxidoreductase [Burkholderiales bacterium]|nr:quinone oxidoreductase [Burkholderiales bacterium]
MLELTEISKPDPAHGEVLVKMAYAGVNFTDIYRRSGLYANSPTYPTPLPYVLGVEGSGTVAKVGEGVANYSVGDRVGFTRNPGSYAEYARVPAHRLLKIPGELGLDVASSVITHGMTAHYLTHEFGLKAGDTCLVHAGAGGVGQILIQLAKMRGARVIATVGSGDKADIARSCGADQVILYRETNFCEAVRELTQGRGVDIVFDSVGKDTLHGSLYSLRRQGLCVLYGHASGKVDNFNTMELAEAGSVFLTRPHMEHYVSSPEEYARRANDILGWVAEGKVKVTIQRIYPLSCAASAHKALEARETRGKLLLKISD